MERSSRFISLSGLSGVGAGVVALAGAGVAHWYLSRGYGYVGYMQRLQSTPAERELVLPFLLGLAVAMLVAALAIASFFTVRRARKAGQPIWSALGRRLALSLLIPVVAGGLFCLALFVRGAVNLVVPGLPIADAANIIKVAL